MKIGMGKGKKGQHMTFRYVEETVVKRYILDVKPR